VLLSTAAAFAHEGTRDHPRWYRGNTHAHTVLCGHADSTPEAVARWYLDRGYHFLCLSEHNRFIDPATVALPEGRRGDFILVPGEEITGRHVHMTGLNVNKLVVPVDQSGRTGTIQGFTDRARAAAGTPIINHPNFTWALTTADIRPVKRCYLFELYNGHPAVNNEGDATRPSTEAMWDELLTDGMVIYGVSSDDAHEFKTSSKDKSNPGRGWVVVRSSELSPGTIAAAIDRGEFYSSSGVMLKDVAVTETEYTVSVDRGATEAEARKPELVGRQATKEAGAAPGYRIDFIGPGGKVLHTVNDTEATYQRPPGLAYVRAKVTYTREADGALVEHAAWTQPAFGDKRLEGIVRDPAPAPDHGHPH
jgi:hypothetical protein